MISPMLASIVSSLVGEFERVSVVEVDVDPDFGVCGVRISPPRVGAKVVIVDSGVSISVEIAAARIRDSFDDYDLAYPDSGAWARSFVAAVALNGAELWAPLVFPFRLAGTLIVPGFDRPISSRGAVRLQRWPPWG